MRRTSLLVILALILAPISNAPACRPRGILPWHEGSWLLRSVSDEIADYERKFGPLPVVDAEGRTWIQLLKLHDHWWWETDDNGALPSNLTRRIVYDPTGAVRFVGPNGVDDGGAGDDWEVRRSRTNGALVEREPDWRVWHPTEYAAMEREALARGMVVVAAGVITAVFRGRCWLILIVTTSFYGALFFDLRSAPGVLVYRWPSWVYFAEGFSGLSLLVAVATTLSAVIIGAMREAKRLSRAAKGGFCSACDYDLSGLQGDRCPECGAAIQHRIASVLPE